MSDQPESRMRELTYKLIAMAPEAPPFPEESMVQLDTRPTRPSTTPQTSLRRPIAWALAAAVAVIVLVGVPLVLLSPNNDVDPVPPASNGTGSDATATTLPAEPTQAPPTEAIALSAAGLGIVDLGADVEATILAVSAVLGAPTQDTGWVDASFSNCSGTELREVNWNTLYLGFTDAADKYAPGGGRHFFQYMYGGEPSGLSTDQGITVGSTVADLRAAYGADLELWDWSATGPRWMTAGGLSGNLTGTGEGVVDTDIVLGVEGGVPCPE